MSLPIEQMGWSLTTFPRSLRLLRFATESNSRQRLLLSTPKRLLLKIPYRFNTGYQVSTCHHVNGACDWFLSPRSSAEPAMNVTSGFQEVRSFTSRSSAYRFLSEQRPQFEKGAWHVLRTQERCTDCHCDSRP